MAVLQRLRGWGIFLSILVALPLLLFIIDPSQIMQTVQSVSSRNDVGNIAGKRVSYMDFQQEVDNFQKVAEIMTGNSASGEQAQKQARDAAKREAAKRSEDEAMAAEIAAQEKRIEEELETARKANNIRVHRSGSVVERGLPCPKSVVKANRKRREAEAKAKKAAAKKAKK